MAFTYSELYRLHGTNGVIVVGTYTNTAGSTGGVIQPSLAVVHNVDLQPMSSSIQSASVVNQVVADFPITSQNGVTIVTTANEIGLYKIIGV